MALKLVTPPAAEPITLVEAKSNLRIDHADEDSHINILIAAARRLVERETARALITQTWQLFLDKFPTAMPDPDRRVQLIRQPLPPLQSITHIKYVDTDGVLQTWPSADYRVDNASEPARITPEFEKQWPEIRSVINAVEIQFVAGYGNTGSDVPEELRQAMHVLVAHWYENREAVMTDLRELPEPVQLSFESLISNYRVWRLAA